MKVTFFTLILLTSSITTLCAQTRGDSGKSPWKLPFSILLVADYEENDFDAIYDINSVNYTLDTTLADVNVSQSSVIQMVIDSTFAQSSAGYTLDFNKDTNEDFGHSFSQDLQITFDSEYDRIISLSCSTDAIYNCGHCGSETNVNFTFTGLRFDSTSILYPDSTISRAKFSYSSVVNNDVWYQNTEARETDYAKSIGVSQISIGGIFRAMTLNAPANISNSHQTLQISLRSYPNPFSQSSTITFSSQFSGYADVSIANILGSEVAHLFSGILVAGEHSFVWSNPTGLPDGNYECIIRMNGRIEALPMVLLR